MANRVRVAVEAAEKRVFVSALDWPGWSRSGRTEDLAVEAFLAAAPRYAAVVAEAGLALDADGIEIDPVERMPGDASTEYGVPRAIGDEDRKPVDAGEAARLAAIVEASWAAFDRVAAAAPEELRKGPRGGGRDRSKIVAHVNDADGAYANQMGLKAGPGGVPAMRAAMLEVLRTPSDGTPIAGRKWTPRYAARRVAWHALDHAWEIEDRTDPA
jgi:hypothetical protein